MIFFYVFNWDYQKEIFQVYPLEITYSNSISFERIFAKVQSERKSYNCK